MSTDQDIDYWELLFLEEMTDDLCQRRAFPCQEVAIATIRWESHDNCPDDIVKYCYNHLIAFVSHPIALKLGWQALCKCDKCGNIRVRGWVTF